MDYTTIVQLIGSLGFPIVMCLMLFDQLKKQNELHKEEMDKMSDSYNNTTTAITSAINNNTVALTTLTAKVEQMGGSL